MKTYDEITHRNSNRARRRGLFSLIKPHFSVQTFRSDGPMAEPLEHRDSRDVLRSLRSRYCPHVGAKHLARAAR